MVVVVVVVVVAVAEVVVVVALTGASNSEVSMAAVVVVSALSTCMRGMTNARIGRCLTNKRPRRLVFGRNSAFVKSVFGMSFFFLRVHHDFVLYCCVL